MSIHNPFKRTRLVLACLAVLLPLVSHASTQDQITQQMTAQTNSTMANTNNVEADSQQQLNAKIKQYLLGGSLTQVATDASAEVFTAGTQNLTSYSKPNSNATNNSPVQSISALMKEITAEITAEWAQQFQWQAMELSFKKGVVRQLLVAEPKDPVTKEVHDKLMSQVVQLSAADIYKKLSTSQVQVLSEAQISAPLARASNIIASPADPYPQAVQPLMRATVATMAVNEKWAKMSSPDKKALLTQIVQVDTSNAPIDLSDQNMKPLQDFLAAQAANVAADENWDNMSSAQKQTLLTQLVQMGVGNNPGELSGRRAKEIHNQLVMDAFKLTAQDIMGKLSPSQVQALVGQASSALSNAADVMNLSPKALNALLVAQSAADAVEQAWKNISTSQQQMALEQLTEMGATISQPTKSNDRVNMLLPEALAKSTTQISTPNGPVLVQLAPGVPKTAANVTATLATFKNAMSSQNISADGAASFTKALGSSINITPNSSYFISQSAEQKHKLSANASALLDSVQVGITDSVIIAGNATTMDLVAKHLMSKGVKASQITKVTFKPSNMELAIGGMSGAVAANGKASAGNNISAGNIIAVQILSQAQSTAGSEAAAGIQQVPDDNG